MTEEMTLLPLLIQLLGASHPLVLVVAAIPTIVGVASLVTKGVTTVTKITPNTKDDAFASKLEANVSKVVSVLDKLALNPDISKARRKN